MEIKNRVILEGFVLRNFGRGLIDLEVTLDDGNFSKVDFIF
jgi:hypothetical protein